MWKRKEQACPKDSQLKTQDRQKNTTEVKNQNSLPQIENREKTYAQAVTNLNKQNNVQDNEEVKQTLQCILDKLNKQEALFITFDERITKLEYSAHNPKQGKNE